MIKGISVSIKFGEFFPGLYIRRNSIDLGEKTDYILSPKFLVFNARIQTFIKHTDPVRYTSKDSEQQSERQKMWHALEWIWHCSWTDSTLGTHYSEVSNAVGLTVCWHTLHWSWHCSWTDSTLAHITVKLAMQLDWQYAGTHYSEAGSTVGLTVHWHTLQWSWHCSWTDSTLAHITVKLATQLDWQYTGTHYSEFSTAIGLTVGWHTLQWSQQCSWTDSSPAHITVKLALQLDWQ